MKKLILVIILLIPSLLVAAGKPKLLLLQFTNIDNNAASAYLETTITDAVREELKKKFIFQEPTPTALEQFSSQNYFYKEDFHSKSVSLKMGLEMKQDVVISGHYRLKDNQITTTVRIYDIRNKNIVADFPATGPADNRLFESVAAMSAKVAKEAGQVLPNKDDWEKSGYSGPSDTRIFGDPELAFRTGGFLYSGGYSDYFQPEVPSFGLEFRTSMLFLDENAYLTVQGARFEDNLVEGNETKLQRLDYNVERVNYQLTVMPGYRYNIIPNLFVFGKLGGGYIFQQNEATGPQDESLQNSFPFLGLAVEFSYNLNQFLSVAVEFLNGMELEDETTMIHAATLGVNFKL